MAPGSPGDPQEPAVIYEEGFENRTADSNILLTDYTSTGGMTYTADSFWVDRGLCNGIIINQTSPRSGGDCGTAQTYDSLTAIPYALGMLAGMPDPAVNAAASSYTANAFPAVSNLVQFRTNDMLTLPTANRFVTFSVDAAATNCFATHPRLRFYLLDDSGNETPVSQTAIDPCDDDRSQVVTASTQNGDSHRVSVGTFPADASMLLQRDQLGIVMRNENGSGSGNDGGYDNIRVLDVTPQLDKELTPAEAPLGGAATLTFTVTNTSELAAKRGWSFADNLPDGLTVADPADAATTCANANVTAAAGATTVEASGDLEAGDQSCTVTVQVTSTVPGTYDNCPDDLDLVGLGAPACASITFQSPPPLGECDARAFHIFGEGGNPSDLHALDLVTGQLNVVDEGLGADDDIRVNAMGYHVGDDRIYGVEQTVGANDTTGYLVVIGADGTASRLGPVPDLAGLGHSLITGDVSTDGYLYATDNAVGGTVYVIDLDPARDSYLTITRQFELSDGDGTTTPRVGPDWVFHPGDQLLYSVRGGEVVSVDPADGEVDVVFAAGPLTGSFGGMFLDADGFLYAYDNGDGSIHRIDLSNGDALPFSQGDPVSDNDGARCPHAPMPVDFGDAPDDYRTELTDDGPRHFVPGYGSGTDSLTLGGTVDIESDGSPSTPADGDGADEDGVADDIVLTVDQRTVEVSATNNTDQDAVLAGWVDLDIDGEFEAGELVTAPVSAGSGAGSYELRFPAPIVYGDTYARFRLFPADSDVAATGAASAGEVEDYRARLSRVQMTCSADSALFNTGYDGAGGRLPGGSRDPRWQVGVGDTSGPGSVSSWQPAFVPSTRPAAWTPSPYGNANWISYRDSARHTERIEVYFRYTFELAAEVPLDGFALPMAFYADNSVPEVWVNGMPQSGSAPGLPQAPDDPYQHGGFVAGAEASVVLSAGFQHGTNEIVVRVASDPPRVGFMAQIQPGALCNDFGDAPDRYGTSRAQDGPRHAVTDFDGATGTSGLMLGGSIDVDVDGLPGDATGDDGENADDEDGVTGPIVLTEDQQTVVTVSVTNTMGENASLAGWIDLDVDGAFEDGERVTTAVPSGPDPQEVALTFPVATDYGDSYSRFRLFPGDVAEPSPVGSAAAGEVEDHPVTGVVQPPWQCVSDAYLFQYQGGQVPPTSVFSIDMVTGDDEEILSIDGRTINGVAYNPLDDYVYGWDFTAGEFVRIGSDGSVDGLGLPDGWPASIDRVNTAEFGTDGTFWVASGGASTTDLLWAGIDLDPDSPDYFTVDESGSEPIPGNQNLGDWAFSTADDQLYSVITGANGTDRLLVQFDTVSGTLSVEQNLGALTAPNGTAPGAAFGAAYADADGFIYAQDNANGQIWRVNPVTEEAVFFGYGPSTRLNDGARCVLAPLPIDFGDAPATYRTTLAGDGARHRIPDYDAGSQTAPLMLGDANTVDIETDGLPGTNADGDDTDGADDEGAVADPIVLTEGQETTVTVSVTNTTGDNATVAGWIDLDVDGTFEDGERVTAAVPPDPDPQDVQLTFPAPTAYGDTYARFRLLPEGTAVSPTGAAPAGEVEDYPVTGVVQQTWQCTTDGLLFQYPGGEPPTAVQFVDLVTGDVETNALEIDGRSINAAAYNVSDDYIYGWDNELRDGSTTERVGIVRIGSDGSIQELGIPEHENLDPNTTFPAGAIDSQGYYWVASTTNDRATWFKIDLNPGDTFMEVVASGAVGDGAADGFTSSGDWAWVPDGDALYRVMRARGETRWSLFRFDLGTGDHELLGPLPTLDGVTGTFGAAYADPDFLYVSNNSSGDIYRVDIGDVSATMFVEEGPPSSYNDAARCATAPIPIDFGDAPDEAYATTLGADGPRHAVPDYVAASNSAPLMLGTTIDIETDGRPNAAADGDDATGVADEDGVAEPIVVGEGGTTTTVPVTVTNTTGADAILAGWLDLNGNRAFDAGERRTATVPSAADPQVVELAWDVEAELDTESYARFRLFPGDADPEDVAPTGSAGAGEVEDHPVLSTVFDKNAVDVIENGDGTSTIVYDISVTRYGPVGRYDLVDQLRFGAAVTVIGTEVTNTQPGSIGTNDAWNGTSEQGVVSDVRITNRQTHVYRVAVDVSIDEEQVTPDGSDCVLAGGEQGTGFWNTATLTVDGANIEADDCEEFPAVVVDKTIASDPTPVGGGEYEIVYEVVATNNGSATGTYDATDALEYGDGVTVTSQQITGSPAGVTPNPGWDGELDPTIVSGQSIDGADSHTYEVTVRFTVTPDITDAAADCTLGGGESGTGVMNTAAVTTNGETREAEKCVEPPVTRFGKELVGTTRTGANEYELTWALTVEQSGIDAEYDLTDELRMSDAVTVDSATIVGTNPGNLPADPNWNGDTAQTVADEVTIAAGATHSYEVRASVTVDPEAVTPENSDCDLVTGEPGTGSMNTATLTVNGDDREDSHCQPFPAVVIDKQVADGPTPAGGGVFEIVYEVMVSNNGLGPDVYDLSDTLRYSDAVNVQSRRISAAPAGVSVRSDWDGDGQPVIADDADIAGATVDGGPTAHTYEVTVRFTVSPDITTEQGDCQLGTDESGTGLLNEGTATVGGEETTVDTCVEVPFTKFDKEIISLSPNGNGAITATYELTVWRQGPGASYRLTDTLRYGDAVTVESSVVTNTAPSGVTTNPGWDGEIDTVVADGVPLGDGETHVYTVEVVLAVDEAAATPEGSDCTLSDGEGGTGLTNTAAITSGGERREADACSPLDPSPQASPEPTAPTLPPEAGSALPATGVTVSMLMGMALALLLGGAVVAHRGRARERG